MTSREDRVTLSVEIPYETKRELNEEADTLWETVDEALRMYLGIDEKSTEAALEAELESVRDQKEDLLEDLDLLESRISDIQEREEYIDEKLSEVKERKQSYHEQIDELLDEMLDEPNKTILAWSSTLKDLAQQEYGTGTESNIEAVVGDLRSRRNERALDIPDRRFRRKTASRATPSGSVAATDGGTDDPGYRVLNGADSDE